MSNRTTAAAAAHVSSTTAGRRWMSVVFMQGEEADAVLDLIDKNGPDAAIRHLSQWDYGDETRDAALVNGYVYDGIPQSPTDRVVRDDSAGFALTFNQHFGYVSLLRHFDPVVEKVRERLTPPVRLGFDRQRTARRTNGLRL